MSISSANAEEGICPKMHFSLVTGVTWCPWQTDTHGNLSPATVKVIFLVEVDLHPFITNILNAVRQMHHTFLVHKGLALVTGFYLEDSLYWEIQGAGDISAFYGLICILQTRYVQGRGKLSALEVATF